jgi:hypothetical protein
MPPLAVTVTLALDGNGGIVRAPSAIHISQRIARVEEHKRRAIKLRRIGKLLLRKRKGSLRQWTRFGWSIQHDQKIGLIEQRIQIDFTLLTGCGLSDSQRSLHLFLHCNSRPFDIQCLCISRHTQFEEWHSSRAWTTADYQAVTKNRVSDRSG